MLTILYLPVGLAAVGVGALIALLSGAFSALWSLFTTWTTA